MKELTIDQIKVLQLWVDQLSDMQSEITENEVIKWAKSVPIQEIEDVNYAPLYLFGDATIDKAITGLISGEDPTEPARRIFSELKKNFCMDSSVVDIMPFVSNKDLNPIIDLPDSYVKVTGEEEDLDKLVQYIKDNNYLNCDYEEKEDGLYLRTRDSIPVTQKLMKAKINFNRNYKRVYDTKNFSFVKEGELATHPSLVKMGYEVVNYSEIQWLLTNEELDDTYIITKDNPGTTIEVEDMEGNMSYYDNLDEFVKSIEKKSKSNFDDMDEFELVKKEEKEERGKKMLSKQNFGGYKDKLVEIAEEFEGAGVPEELLEKVFDGSAFDENNPGSFDKGSLTEWLESFLKENKVKDADKILSNFRSSTYKFSNIRNTHLTKSEVIKKRRSLNKKNFGKELYEVDESYFLIKNKKGKDIEFTSDIEILEENEDGKYVIYAEDEKLRTGIWSTKSFDTRGEAEGWLKDNFTPDTIEKYGMDVVFPDEDYDEEDDFSRKERFSNSNYNFNLPVKVRSMKKNK
jgi:hypothetical protein